MASPDRMPQVGTTTPPEPSELSAGHAGIDVGKDWLDVAIEPVAGGAGATSRFPNTPTGRQELVGRLRRAAPALVALEATGAYHQPLLVALGEAGLPVALLNPGQVAAFRRTRLGRNKTDRQDALLLARFAAVHASELQPYAPPPAVQLRLQRLLVYREGLSKWRTALRNQREAAQWSGAAELVALLDEDLATVEARLRVIDAHLEHTLKQVPEARVLRTVLGAGALVVAAVLAHLPVTVWGRAKAAAAWAGVHPAVQASGRTSRSRLSKAGCGRLRRYLFMGALAALRHDRDPGMRAFFDRLRSRGMAKKAAAVAVMHKLLRRLMGVLREWQTTVNAGTSPPPTVVVPLPPAPG